MFLKVVFSFILIFGKYINLIEDGRMDARSFCFDIKNILNFKEIFNHEILYFYYHIIHFYFM